MVKKQISKSGFKTKKDAYIAGQRVYEEFISGESTKECNMLYSEYLGWNKIECAENNRMRTIDEIHNNIYQLVKRKI